MKLDEKVARWHWRAVVVEQRSADAARSNSFEFRLLDVHVLADPDTFPYAEGHRLMLEWRNLFYPEGMGGPGSGTAEKFITAQFRRDTPVVRAHGVAGVPFWTVPIGDDLVVRVALAAPDRRFGDNMDADRVLRVSHECGDRRWYVARIDPNKSELSLVAAIELT